MRNVIPQARLTWALLILLTVSVTGCSGVLTSEQPDKSYYTLMPLDGAVRSNTAAAGPALVLKVSAVPGLDTDRILALGPDASLQRYANARWPDHLPEVLESVMKRSLAGSGKLSSVEISARPPEGGIGLELEAQQFYGLRNTSGETSSVVVEMAGRLRCNGRQHPLLLTHSSPVAEERLSRVVAAHQSALDSVTRQLLSEIDRLCL